MRTCLRACRIAAPLVLAAVLAAFAALRVCPRCGYEVGEADAACAHCQATLPVVAPPAPPPEPAPPAPAAPPPGTPAPGPASTPTLPRDVAAAQVQAAREFFDKEVYWGALLFGRNALAILSLLGADGATPTAQTALLVHESRSRILKNDRKCPVCDGTGHKRIQVVTLKGEVLDQDLPGTACPLCRGAAVLAGAAAMPELQRSMAASQRLYEVEQRRRQLDDFQGIWLPYGFSDGLAVRQIADLKKGYGVWCPACLGFGQTGCATCGGTALLKCPNASCVQGTEVCSDCQGKGRKTSTSGSATTLTKRCDTCGGAGKRRCDACSGKGHVPCPDCAERGVLTCKKCSGTGHPAPCTKCSGEGLAVCTRCAGKGQANGPPCTYCQGQGASLCTSCLGTGRERSK